MPKRFGSYTTLKIDAVPNTATGIAALDSMMQLNSLLGVTDRLVGIYMFPRALFTWNGNIQNINPRVLEVVNESAIRLSLASVSPSNIHGYTPKNKKLLTYPYVYCRVTTGTQSADYVYELGTPTYVDNVKHYSVHCYLYGVFTDGPKIFIVPSSYEGRYMDIDKTIIDTYPCFPSAAKPFIQLLGTNGIINKLMLLGTSALIGAGVANIVNENGYRAVNTFHTTTTRTNRQTGKVTEFDVVKSTRQEYKRENTGDDASEGRYLSQIPPIVEGSINSGGGGSVKADSDALLATVEPTGTTNKKVRILTMTIREQEARRIDLFFTMYGYACNKVKVPSRDNRKYWNYVKTCGCRIRAASTAQPFDSIPADYADKICSIYDKGITFWRPDANFGHYEQDNIIVAQG